jgi:predicted peptidase
MKSLLILLTPLCLAPWLKAQSAPEPVQSGTLKWTISHSGELKYLYSLPQGYDANTAKRWPLMLFLHGIGERGSDVKKVLAHGPIKLAREGRDFPFIIVAPQCPDGEFWNNTEALIQLLDGVEKTYRVDTTRVYLTGLSMGGYGAWKLGTTYPERFAAMIPICGGGELLNIRFANPDKAVALKSLAVWAFHGAKDNVVPVTESQRTVDYLKNAGVTEVKLTIYPDAMHDSWTQTFNNPEIYDWLLRHERTNAVPSKP